MNSCEAKTCQVSTANITYSCITQIRINTSIQISATEKGTAE